MFTSTQLAETSIAGRYIVDNELGAGGMGKVYRVHHATLAKEFALKVIAPAFAEDSVARARFLKEAHLASEISHPGIVSVVDFGEDPVVGAYMVMELVDGARLNAERMPMTVRRAIELIAQIADVLDHIHGNGIVHGDVKLENIMLVTESDGPRRRQTVKLLDFGLAERMGARPAQLSGTPQYLAPERIAGGPPTEQTDVYALGVLTFQLLTGAFPFDGDLEAILHAQLAQDPPSISERRREQVDEALESLVRRALAKQPTDRHTSAATFLYELNTVMDMLAISRRRARSGKSKADSRREAMMSALFDHSPYAQAIVRANGEIEIANEAFGQLYDATEGVSVEPRVLECVRQAFTQQQVLERRLGNYHVCFAPFVGGRVHVLVRWPARLS